MSAAMDQTHGQRRHLCRENSLFQAAAPVQRALIQTREPRMARRGTVPTAAVLTQYRQRQVAGPSPPLVLWVAPWLPPPCQGAKPTRLETALERGPTTPAALSRRHHDKLLFCHQTKDKLNTSRRVRSPRHPPGPVC